MVRKSALRNSGIPFDSSILEDRWVNKSAVERRAGTLGKRRSVKKEYQAAWLLRAVTMIDLTTLSGDDTEGNVIRLCAKAKKPVRSDILEQMGFDSLTVGAVCVYHNRISTAVEALNGTGIPVAAVSTGFPAGQIAHRDKLAEIKKSVRAGANEIDIVISRDKVLRGNWRGLYDEICAFREACGESHLKTILATGELGNLENVIRASWVCMMGGADFIKTSTGKESVNATLPVSLVMVRAIREYLEMTGFRVGFKPAGGIRTARQALDWMILMKEEVGDEWLSAELFRFGASGLLGDIERQLEHFATGNYSAIHRHPMA